MIRQATFDDVPRCVAMGLRFVASTIYAGYITHDPQRIEDLVVRVITEGVGFVADVDGEVVGMIGGWRRELPEDGQPYIEETAWWVEPTHRGAARIGVRLHAALEDWARSQGVSMLQMSSPAGAQSVERWYSHAGYTPVETRWTKRL